MLKLFVVRDHRRCNLRSVQGSFGFLCFAKRGISVDRNSSGTYGREFFNFIIWGSERRQSNFLWKLCERRVTEKWHVSEQFMDAITVKRNFSWDLIAWKQNIQKLRGELQLSSNNLNSNKDFNAIISISRENVWGLLFHSLHSLMGLISFSSLDEAKWNGKERKSETIKSDSEKLKVSLH